MTYFVLILLIGLLEFPLVRSQDFKSGPNGEIFDTQGRYRIFHGTNFVLKEKPWYPDVLLNETNVAQLASWGMNSVRLGTMWTGAQPNENSWNQTYYNVMVQIVNNLAKYGIYAILDCHQDVLSSFFCEYDGAPQWVVNKSITLDVEIQTHPFPWPLDNSSGCYGRGWAENYLALATGRAFQDIYENRHNNRDAFINFWNYTASIFKNSTFLGYELWNEPWCGDYFTDPTLLLPGEAGQKNLQPLYDLLYNSISASDKSHLIFFEPVTWSILFNGSVMGTGFTKVPGNDNTRTILSWHYYCWMFSEQNADKFLCDQEMGPDAFKTIKEDLINLKTGGFLTEWGLCDPSKPNGLNECEFVMSMADEYAMSWTNWDWGAGQLQYGWQVNKDWVNAMVRPYVQAYAGIPISISFDPQTLFFNTTFKINPLITAPTELYIPSIHYPTNSFKLTYQCLTLTNVSNYPYIYTFSSNENCTQASISLFPISN